MGHFHSADTANIPIAEAGPSPEPETQAAPTSVDERDHKLLLQSMNLQKIWFPKEPKVKVTLYHNVLGCLTLLVHQ